MNKLLVLRLLLIMSVLFVAGCDKATEFGIDVQVETETDVEVERVTSDTPGVIRGSGNVISEPRPVHDFDEIILLGIGDLYITQGTREALSIKADDNLMQYIEVQVRDNVLTLNLSDEARNANIKPSRDIEFHLDVQKVFKLDLVGAGDINASSLDVHDLEVALTGAGDINITSLTTEEELLVRLSGAGDVHVDTLDAQDLIVRLSGAGDVSVGWANLKDSEVHLNGAGDVELAGQVQEQNVFLSGAGDYDAAELESQTAFVEVSGAGDATVRASDTLDVQVSGPGTVEYYGNPRVSYDVSGGGKLVSLDHPSLEFPGATPTERVTDAPELRGSGNIVVEERAVSDFERVILGGIGEVFITQGQAESLTVEADDNLMQYIETLVQDQTLVLRFTDKAEGMDVQPSRRIKFNVTMREVSGLEIGGVGDINAPSLNAHSLELLVSGVGDIDVNALTVEDDLELVIPGVGDINIDSLNANGLEFILDGVVDINVGALDAQELVAVLNGTGDVVLAGQVVEQSIFLNGAINYYAPELSSQTAFVEAGGAGQVTVWASGRLDVQIGGPSTVAYHGNPQVLQDVSRVGRLIRLDDSEPTQAPATTPADYWPTSTPTEQGLDAGLLAAMVDAIEDEDYDVDSVSVIRNGYLVLDEYFHSFEPNSKHVINSCTKSVVSALIGIAIDQGYIEGVDQPVLDLFPGYTADNLDADKQAMTLEDLLTMSSGLECRDSYLYDWRGLYEMGDSDDWVQFMLDLPMAEPPGTRFEYCNGGSFLLSAIIQEATGVSALEFAQEHLFGPLGITDVHWPSNPAGITIGWGDMHLQPHDMAKIGYLYLNDGQWEGEQVVSTSWVEASTQAHISATLFDGYGYQWWVDADGYYMAVGYAGQFIYVVPEKDMVVVFTSDLAESDFYVPYTLLNEYIIPAATGN